MHSRTDQVTFLTTDAARAAFAASWKLVGMVATEWHMGAIALVDTFGVMNPEAIEKKSILSDDGSFLLERR